MCCENNIKKCSIIMPNLGDAFKLIYYVSMMTLYCHVHLITSKKVYGNHSSSTYAFITFYLLWSKPLGIPVIVLSKDSSEV